MFRNGFRHKIMIYLTVTVLAQVLWIGFIFSRDISDYTEHYKKDIVETNLKAQISLVEQWFAIQESIIKNYASMMSKVANGSANEAALTNFMQAFEQQESTFSNVYYTSEKGLNVVSGGLLPRVDGRERMWYKGAKVREFYVSLPYVDALTSDYVITLSVAVKDEAGQIIGVLGADLPVSDLFERIRFDSYDLIQAVVITDQVNQALYYENYSEKRQSTDNSLEMHAYYKQLEQKNEKIRILLPDMKASLNVYLKNDRYLTEVINYNYNFWIAILAGFFGILVVLWYLSKFLAKPIQMLSERIRNLARQENDANISQEIMDDDLWEIMALFKQLDDHIHENIKQINQMNENMKDANVILENKNEEFRNSLSELYSANASLKQSEKIYQNLINNIEEMIWIVDLTGKVTYANGKFYETLGFDADSTAVLHLKDFLSEIKASDEFNGVGFFAKRDFNELELRLDYEANHKHLDVLVSTTIIFFKSEPMSIQFIGRDVTEEKLLYHQYAQKNREMMILNDISRSLTMKEDLNSILQLITDRISNLLNVSGVSVRMLDNEAAVLKIAAYSGQAANKIYPQDPGLDSHMGLALREARIVSLTTPEDLIYEDAYLASLLTQVGAVYYFPLANRDNRFGVLTVIAQAPLENDKIKLLKSLSENASTAIEKATLFERLRNNYLMTIEALSNALEEKVFNYKNHTKRVAEFSKLIAERFYFSQKDLDDIYISGLLHDIGKLGIADDILNHEDIMNETEAAMMRAHVEIGKHIIQPIGLNEQIVDGIYLHHKHFDLSGYPETVNLDRLPLFARIIGLADAFDSELIEARMAEDWQLEVVFNQLEMHKETLYCPEVLAALWELIQDNRERVIQISEI